MSSRWESFIVVSRSGEGKNYFMPSSALPPGSPIRINKFPIGCIFWGLVQLLYSAREPFISLFENFGEKL